jgi:hypothetical protein
MGSVDVVLNTLTSPGLVCASLSVLQHSGCFVEISKRDVVSVARLQSERPDARCSFLAVDFLPEASIQHSMLAVSAGVSCGMLRPLPAASHSLGSVAAALRQLSQARHVGKVVVSTSVSLPQPLALTGGKIIITGGLGHLGSLLVAWLLSMGVRHLHLVSRSAGRMPDSIALAAASAAGACVTASQADLSCSSDCAALFSAHLSSPDADIQMPVAAVLHAGGVLHDALLPNQTLSGMRSVLAAKMQAIPALSSAAQLQPLISCVLFSSVASLLGSPGQSNYAAANAGLDASAESFMQCGLAAVSMQWGAWAGGGMAAADAQTAARVERMGMSLIQPQAGLAALEGE